MLGCTYGGGFRIEGRCSSAHRGLDRFVRRKPEDRCCIPLNVDRAAQSCPARPTCKR
jgi:hypothetical protein